MKKVVTLLKRGDLPEREERAMAAPQRKRGISEEAERDSKRARAALSVVCGAQGSEAVARAEGALEREASARAAAREARVEADEAATEAEFSLRQERRDRRRLVSAITFAAELGLLGRDAIGFFNRRLDDMGQAPIDTDLARYDFGAKMDLADTTHLAALLLQDARDSVEDRRPPNALRVLNFEIEWTRLQVIRRRAGLSPLKPV